MLELLRGDKTIGQSASERKVAATQLSQWRSIVRQVLPGVFDHDLLASAVFDPRLPSAVPINRRTKERRRTKGDVGRAAPTGSYLLRSSVVSLRSTAARRSLPTGS